MSPLPSRLPGSPGSRQDDIQPLKCRESQGISRLGHLHRYLLALWQPEREKAARLTSAGPAAHHGAGKSRGPPGCSAGTSLVEGSWNEKRLAAWRSDLAGLVIPNFLGTCGYRRPAVLHSCSYFAWPFCRRQGDRLVPTARLWYRPQIQTNTSVHEVIVREDEVLATNRNTDPDATAS